MFSFSNPQWPVKWPVERCSLWWVDSGESVGPLIPVSVIPLGQLLALAHFCKSFLKASESLSFGQCFSPSLSFSLFFFSPPLLCFLNFQLPEAMPEAMIPSLNSCKPILQSRLLSGPFSHSLSNLMSALGLSIHIESVGWLPSRSS